MPVYTGMVHWPDNPPVRIERMLDMEHGDVCNVSTISMGAHTGTHMDSPLHFVRDGVSMDNMPLEAVIGPVRVLQSKARVCIALAELRGQKIRRGERILFKTRNSARWGTTDQFDKDFVYISHEAAAYLAERGVQTVGVDYLSVGGYHKDGVETHHALLGQGIWIIEGLNLSAIKPGRYEMVCLPVKIRESDGAPARVVLRPH